MKWPAIARLAALVACVGLTTSRLGLLAHELLGHGGATLLMGGRVTAVRLSLFSGGWVHHDSLPHGGDLFVSVAGCGIEIMIATAILIALARRPDSLGVRVVRSCAGALIVHPLWYIATGTFHGFGDGIGLYRALGDARLLVVLPLSAIAIGVAFVISRHILGAFIEAVGGPRRVVGAALAVAIGLGLQAGASVAERRVRSDAVYERGMAHENTRVVDRAIANWLDEQRRLGTVPNQAQVNERVQTLEDAHRQFPFMYVFSALLVLATLAGAIRPQALGGAVVTSRMLARAGAIALGSIALVIAIGAALS